MAVTTSTTPAHEPATGSTPVASKAFGVVYATVFVAQSLPQDNPVMHGFRDGGTAAMDELSRS